MFPDRNLLQKECKNALNFFSEYFCLYQSTILAPEMSFKMFKDFLVEQLENPWDVARANICVLGSKMAKSGHFLAL